MRTRNHILSYLFISLLAAGMAACTHDLTDDGYGIITPGESTITAEVEFKPMRSGLNGTTRTQGDAIKVIKDLSVLLYDSGGNLVKDGYHLLQEGSAMGEYEITEEERKVSDTKYAEIAEDRTQRATFTMTVPDGTYYIYAVANMGDMSQKYATEIQTAKGLKSISLTWDATVVENNAEMFGFFHDVTNGEATPDEAQLITIGGGKKRLHAWIKRAASKVTVAVDGSGLREGVNVWIKSIQVKAIARRCDLGQKNTIGVTDLLLSNGEMIKVSETSGAEAGDAANLVTKELSYPRNIADAHTETADALFFYENMQGEGQLKTQLWPNGTVGASEDRTKPQYPDGNSPDSKGYKDSKIFGTYVEVIGYYKREAIDGDNAGETEGPIIYRFMLGKNVTTNYDAERNYHYKLTLKLKNFANDNDWHIVYNQEPEILADEPYYISYLYNQTMNYPIKIVGGELVALEAVIPDDDVTKASWAPKSGEVTEADKTAANANGGKVYWDGDVDNPGPWNGFLSLRKTTVAQFGIWPDTDENGNKIETYGPEVSTTYTYNKTYWDANKRGERTYDVSTGTHEDSDGDYTIEQSAPGEYSVEIPLYTRARVMVSQTGYSGNNPYAAYQRESKVIVKAKIRKPDGTVIDKEKPLQIIQSRRILNPKAVWRKGDSDAPFHVQLKILPSQQAPKFENLLSDGPWRAEVTVGKDWIQLEPTDGASQGNLNNTIISGLGNPYDENNTAGRTIDFSFRPKGTTTTPRGGIITVYYNNYTCVHTIFVRQGYDPVSFYGSNVMWHTYNLRTGGYNDTIAEEAPDPEVEGAYFRKYNRQYPIDARSNTVEKFAKNGMDRDDFIIAESNTSATNTKKWDEIRTNATSWGTFKVNINGKDIESRLPTKADWDEIISPTSTVYGFGVLYADGATETQEDIKLAYGATPTDHNSGRGMRGVIVCDENTGTQIFLPIAASGYGRFKQKSSMDRYNRRPAGEGGVIQYANRYTWYPSTKNTLGVTNYPVQYHPLFYDLWMAEGTYYWFADSDALDINFYTLNIAIGKSDDTDLGLVWRYPDSNWAGGPDPSGSDAIHIRLVHDKDQENK